MGVGSSVFLMWTPGTWGEPMLTDEHFFSLFVGWLVGRCQKWPLSGDTDERGWTELYSGKGSIILRREGQPPGSSEIVVRLDGGRRLVLLEPLEHSVLWAPQDRRDVSSSEGEVQVDTMSACLPRVFSDDQGVDVAPLDGRPEAA